MQTVYKLGKLPQYQSHMIKIWRHCVSAVANRKLNFIIQGVKMHFIWNRVKIKSLVNSNLDLNPLKRRNICMHSISSGKQFKKNFLCSVYKVISQGKWLSSYKWLSPSIHLSFSPYSFYDYGMCIKKFGIPILKVLNATDKSLKELVYLGSLPWLQWSQLVWPPQDHR